MTTKILVTGARGFLGSSVARHYIDRGAIVAGIGHGMAHVDEAPARLASWHSAEVTLDSLVTYADEPDVIVHCAGSGSVPFSMAHPLQDFGRTVTSTAAVLEYIRLHSPATKLVYPSSAAVYGVVEQLPIAESERLAPASPYGTHKMIAEQLCKSYASNFGLQVAVIRFFSIYGDGLRKQLLWDACRKLDQREVSSFSGTGMELRDWLHINDASSLVELAANRASSGCPVVNGASGRAQTVESALLHLYEAWGASAKPAFSGCARRGDPPGYQADMSLAQSWGWAQNVGFDAGIRRYVEWFRRNTA